MDDPNQNHDGSCESQPDEEALESIECPVAPPLGGLAEVIQEGRRRLGEHRELIDRSHQALYSVLAYVFVQSAWLDHFSHHAEKYQLLGEVLTSLADALDIPSNLAERTARDLLLILFFGGTENEAPMRSKYRTLMKAAADKPVPFDETAFVEWVNESGGYEAIITAYRAAHPSKRNAANRRTGGKARQPGTLLKELESKLGLDWTAIETVHLHIDPEQDVHEGLSLFLAHPQEEISDDGTCSCSVIQKIAKPSLIELAAAEATREVDEAEEVDRFEREALWKVNRFMLRYRHAMPGKADVKAYRVFSEAILQLWKHPVLGSKYFDGPPEFPPLEVDSSEGIDLRLHKARVDAGQLDPALFVGNVKLGALVPYDYKDAVDGLKYQRSIRDYIASASNRRKAEAVT